EPRAQAEIVIADPRVAADERAVHNRPAGGALDGGDSGSDVERQGRVILEHAAQLKAMTDPLPDRIRRARGGMDTAVENDAVALVVIAPAIVPPDVVKIDGRAKEKLTHIVQRLRPGVGDAVVSPARRALHKGDVQSVIAGIGSRR